MTHEKTHDETTGRDLEQALGGPIAPPPAVDAGIHARIVADLRPVRPLRAPWVRAAAAAAIGLGLTLGLAAVTGMHLREPIPWSGFLAAATLFAGGLCFAMSSVVPGTAPPLSWRAGFLALPPLGFGALVLATCGATGPVGSAHCLEAGLLISLTPAAVAAFFVRRGFPTLPATTGAIAGLAAGLLGVGMLHLSCPDLAGPHLLLWHGGVLGVAGTAGALLGRFGLVRGKASR